MSQLYLRRKEAAEYLKGQYQIGSAATLAKLATVGGGPLYQKYGRYPVYTQENLDIWATARMTKLVSSSAEYQPSN